MVYEKLKEIRNAKGITAKEMAKALGLKTEAAYYKKESGMVRFSLNEAKIVSGLLKMPIDEIFFDHQVSCKDTNAVERKQPPTGTCG